MNICLVDNTEFQYDSNFLYSQKLRGAESVLINISNELKNIGNKVTIINNCPKTTIINDIRWININAISKIENFDLVIANGDCNLFKYANSKKNILFSHSVQTIEKFIRKNQLFSYLKYRPKVCFISNYHKQSRSKLLYLFGNINLRWSVDDIFIKSQISDNVDQNLAIFTSRPDRNLEMLINIWENLIEVKNKKIKLMITDNNFNIISNNIFKRKLIDQRNLIEELSKSRVCLIPGHKAELFCLAAEEAKELCIPLITLGIGCLSERVEHGKTGFVAKNNKEFANYTIELFSNNDLWKSMRNYLISIRGKNTWHKVAKELISQIN